MSFRTVVPVGSKACFRAVTARPQTARPKRPWRQLRQRGAERPVEQARATLAWQLHLKERRKTLQLSKVQSASRRPFKSPPATRAPNECRRRRPGVARSIGRSHIDSPCSSAVSVDAVRRGEDNPVHLDALSYRLGV